jgi:membrane protein implicated in regulation of membrane protease activity
MMTDWIVWLLLAGVLVIFELFTGTFYLLMIAIGFAAGALAALLGIANPLQYILATVVGVVATYALRRSKLGKFNQTDAARDRNVNLDIGETLRVEEWQQSGDHRNTARAMYRGAMWDIELAPDTQAQAGLFTIREVRGSRLIVANDTHNLTNN